MGCRNQCIQHRIWTEIPLCTVVPSVIIPIHVHVFRHTKKRLGVHILPTQQSFSCTSYKLRSADVRRSDPKSLLHFQESPLEWQTRKRTTFGWTQCVAMGVTPSVTDSQWIDIFVLMFSLQCSKEAQGNKSLEAVVGIIYVESIRLCVKPRKLSLYCSRLSNVKYFPS